MKVLKNNFSGKPIKEVEHIYPRKIKCDKCESELEYEKSDIKIGAYGCPEIICPLCGMKIPLYDEEELVLTRENISFPTHFWHTSKETGAVEVPKWEIEERIRKGIDWLRNNKEEFFWFTESGDSYVEVRRYDGDEVYNIFVSKNYYETDIPFSKEDYK